MRQEDYDIQKQVDSLMYKVLESWKREGKWDGSNPNSPFYGFEKDPLLRILLTAFVYQTNGIRLDIQNFEKNMVGDLQRQLLPYQLTQAVPAFSMIKTIKKASETDDVFCDEESTFLVKKESLRSKEYFPFHPLFKTKILGISVSGVTKIAGDKWNVNIDVTDQDSNLSYLGFMINGLRYSDVNVYWNNEKLPLIRPWEFDRFPKTSWFSEENLAYNKSVIFGADNQWHDLWSELGINYYMVAPTFKRPINSDMINFVFEFSGMTKPFSFEADNLVFNCFPALNVIKKDFSISNAEPIVKLAIEHEFPEEEEEDVPIKSTAVVSENNHQDFFMNLIKNDNCSIEEHEKFSIRRYGCERFNINELIRLADQLSQRYETDFYAFQNIHKMQNSEKIRRLNIVLKDVLDTITSSKTPKTGVYAVLKHGKVGNDVKVQFSALFTDGAYSNDIDIFSDVTPPKTFEKKETRLLFKTFGGRDEVTNKEETNMLMKYYARTKDRIVTRADLKAFCYKYFIQKGLGHVLLDVISVIERNDGLATQHVTLHLRNDFVRDHEDIPVLIDSLKKLIQVRSVNVIPISVEYIAIV